MRNAQIFAQHAPLAFRNISKKTNYTSYFALLVCFRYIKSSQDQLIFMMNSPMVTVEIMLRIHSTRPRINRAGDLRLYFVNILFKSVNTSDVDRGVNKTNVRI